MREQAHLMAQLLDFRCHSLPEVFLGPCGPTFCPQRLLDTHCICVKMPHLRQDGPPWLSSSHHHAEQRVIPFHMKWRPRSCPIQAPLQVHKPLVAVTLPEYAGSSPLPGNLGLVLCIEMIAFCIAPESCRQSLKGMACCRFHLMAWDTATTPVSTT